MFVTVYAKTFYISLIGVFSNSSNMREQPHQVFVLFVVKVSVNHLPTPFCSLLNWIRVFFAGSVFSLV